jgi:hypothetical protein
MSQEEIKSTIALPEGATRLPEEDTTSADFRKVFKGVPWMPASRATVSLPRLCAKCGSLIDEP